MASDLEQLVAAAVDRRLHELRHLFHLDGASPDTIGAQDAAAGSSGGGSEDAGGFGAGGSEDAGGSSQAGAEDGGGAAAGGGVDSMTPIYLTIDPVTGLTGGLFPGGVQMLEGTALGYTAASSLGFMDAGAVVREYLHADRAGVTHRLRVTSNPDAADSAILDLLASESTGAAAQVIASAADSTPNASGNKVIIDSLNRSSFVQAPGGGVGRSAIGTVNGTFPNAQSMTAVVVNHGLGAAPQFVVIVEDGFQFGTNITFIASTFTATQFTINAWAGVALNAVCAMRWFAVA